MLNTVLEIDLPRNLDSVSPFSSSSLTHIHAYTHTRTHAHTQTYSPSYPQSWTPLSSSPLSHHTCTYLHTLLLSHTLSLSLSLSHPKVFFRPLMLRWKKHISIKTHLTWLFSQYVAESSQQQLPQKKLFSKKLHSRLKLTFVFLTF